MEFAFSAASLSAMRGHGRRPCSAVVSLPRDAWNRDIVRQGIERLNGFFLLQEGLELRHAALLQINRKSAAAFGERRVFCFAVAFPLLRPAGQQRFSVFAALRPIA